jgi:hypothetical protein
MLRSKKRRPYRKLTCCSWGCHPQFGQDAFGDSDLRQMGQLRVGSDQRAPANAQAAARQTATPPAVTTSTTTMAA